MIALEDIEAAVEVIDRRDDTDRLLLHIDRIKNVGLSLESYHAIEALHPGIFSAIDPRKVSQSPSQTFKKQATIAMEGSGLLEVLGRAAAGAAIGGLIGLLVGWLIEKIGGGSGGGGGGGSIVTYTTKINIKLEKYDGDKYWKKILEEHMSLVKPLGFTEEETTALASALRLRGGMLSVDKGREKNKRIAKTNIDAIRGIGSFPLACALLGHSPVAGAALIPVLVPSIEKIDWVKLVKDLSGVLSQVAIVLESNEMTFERNASKLKTMIDALEKNIKALESIESEFGKNREILNGKFSILAGVTSILPSPAVNAEAPPKEFSKLKSDVGKVIEFQSNALDLMKSSDIIRRGEEFKELGKGTSFDKLSDNNPEFRAKLNPQIKRLTHVSRLLGSSVMLMKRANKTYHDIMDVANMCADVDKAMAKAEKTEKTKK